MIQTHSDVYREFGSGFREELVRVLGFKGCFEKFKLERLLGRDKNFIHQSSVLVSKNWINKFKDLV